jgi:DNA-binding CsgD family transcriptional regulator
MLERSHPRFIPLLAGLLTTLTGLGLLDLLQDDPEVWRRPHALLELLYIAASLGGAVFLWRGWRGAEATLSRTRHDLETGRSERDAWRARAQGYLKGLGEAISEQFRAWGLTSAEGETALFLLKGFSHKEIGAMTGRSERTVRQHAIAVYRKAGIAGRAELSAFFLEDLLLPGEAGPAPAP